MKPIKFLMLLAVLAVIVGCSRTEQHNQQTAVSSVIKDQFSGYYLNSNNRCAMTSIEIIGEEPGYKVRIYWTDSIEDHDGRKIDNEIAVRFENENELRLYKNGNELRVYQIIRNGYQPEDIEWTFYKNIVH